MKKILSMLLAAVMAVSLTTTVFAVELEDEETGFVKLTVEVPLPEVPEYTLHIPADVELEYGNTEPQEIGEVYASGCKYFRDNTAISCELDFRFLSHEDRTAEIDAIPVTYTYNRTVEKKPENNVTGETLSLFGRLGIYNNENGYLHYTLFATIEEEDWNAAEPGKYTATLRFDFVLDEAPIP